MPAVSAEDVQGFRSTDLPIPRFVSLRSDKVYARTGPALSYPIRWVYQKEGMPVEIVQEFDTWRKIRDKDGEEGWVHQSLLSGTRRVLLNTEDAANMRREPKPRGRMVARLEPGIVGDLRECREGWCYLDVQGYRGWVERNFLWGIYPEEVFD